MLFIMTIRANDFQVFQTVIIPVSVFMMKLKYFILIITTPFTPFPFNVKNVGLNRFLSYYFVSRAIDFVDYAGSIFI